jgi:hypothetical protein
MQEITALVDHWRDDTTWSNERLTMSIEADGIDILVDLAGLTAKPTSEYFRNGRRRSKLAISAIRIRPACCLSTI